MMYIKEAVIGLVFAAAIIAASFATATATTGFVYQGF